MTRKPFCLTTTALVALIALVPPSAFAASCAELAKVALPHTTISLAEEVAAGAFKVPVAPGAPPADFSKLPSFCRVAGTMRPTADSDIRFEVWLPSQGWNGKFVGVGNGVWAGAIPYYELANPLQSGYAVAATDDGHQGNALDAGFVVGHPEKLVDFGHRAMHETAVSGKAITRALYGRQPSRSLFVSCSTGGRHGLMEAYRYPDDYDGISAMAPANPMVSLMVASLWTAYVAMKDEASRLSPQIFRQVHDAAVQACDADDGVKDGLIGAPQRCRFDVGTLPLTAPQIAALRGIYAGVRNPRTGAQIYPGFSLGSEGMLPILASGPQPFGAAMTWLRDVVLKDPQWDFRSFDYDRGVEQAMKVGSDALDVPPTGLDRYLARGGKLLLSHGWADGLIPAESTVQFYEQLRGRGGVRLFMAPGVAHCAGGDGPSVIDHLGAIDRWVATGKAPEQLVARSVPGAPARSRPLCPYPQEARYTGKGSSDEAANFRCELPAK